MHNAEVLFVLFLIDHKLVRTSGMGHSSQILQLTREWVGEPD